MQCCRTSYVLCCRVSIFIYLYIFIFTLGCKNQECKKKKKSMMVCKLYPWLESNTNHIYFFYLSLDLTKMGECDWFKTTSSQSLKSKKKQRNKHGKQDQLCIFEYKINRNSNYDLSRPCKIYYAKCMVLTHSIELKSACTRIKIIIAKIKKIILFIH